MTHTPPLTRISAAAVGAVLLIGATASCGLLGGNEPKRDEPGGQITESSDADVFALQVGDCFNSADLEEEILNVPVVPCADPHDSEIFAEKTLPKGDYPTDLQDQADAYCLEAFPAFIGAGHDESTSNYGTWNLVPTQQGWEKGDDRLIQCVAGTIDGSTFTGTLKDIEAS